MRAGACLSTEAFNERREMLEVRRDAPIPRCTAATLVVLASGNLSKLPARALFWFFCKRTLESLCLSAYRRHESRGNGREFSSFGVQHNGEETEEYFGRGKTSQLIVSNSRRTGGHINNK